ncbi:MAG TPA: NYN domain-containing protein [Verrucomicrobiae bacterium]|nr:NYN domain-containing protein [Verrucomicrobiae bacterium]
MRILVDGYSLLHNWQELAPGKPRYSAAARSELIRQLTRYHDASGVPVTVIFDGASGLASAEEPPSTPEMEILYSQQGQTADQMIERAASRLLDYGEVLVVTDDLAERDTVSSAGAMVSSCANFIATIASTDAEVQRTLKRHNRSEREKFQRSKKQ